MTPLYNRMVEALESAGYETSLSAIGRLFDVWPNAVAKWRDGESLPELGKLLELVQITGCSAEWLLTGAGSRTRKNNVDALTEELLKLWAALDEPSRKQLLDFVRFQADRAAKAPPETP